MARRKEIKNLFGTLYEYEYDGDKLVSFKKADDKTGKNGISTGKSNAPKKEAPKSAVKKVDDKLSSVSKSLGERVYGETTKDVTLGKDFRQDTKRLDEQKTIEKAEKSISGYAKAKAWALKMEYERTDGHSRLSSTIGDDIQKLMSDYNNAKNNKVDQTAYDELRERSKKIRDDLRNYHDYYSLYNTDDAQNAKTFGDLEQLASGIHDDLHYSDDVNGFYNRKQSQGVQSYAELRQKRGLLQRKRGNDGYDTDRINAELEALDKYGYNQNVIDSMTDEDWEYEKQRLGEYAKNAKNEADKIKNTLTGNAPYITPYLTSDKVNSGNTKEIADRLKSAEDKFYYYNNLLSEVEELERMTKTEREIAKKWGDYKSKIPDGGVRVKIEAPGNGWEYNAVNHGFVPEEQIVTDATGGGWVANKSEIHNAKLYNFAIADEVNMYNYLHDNVSPEKATEYLKDITPILNKRMSQYESAEAYKKAQESPIFATIGSTAYNGLFGGVEALINDAINGVTAISGKEIDPYSPRFQTYRDMQATQQGVKDTIDSKVGKIIYGAGTQIAELTISMLAAQGIGSAIGGLAKGANAAQIANKASNIANQVLLSSKSMLDTTLRYKESGESDLAAVGMGMLSGLIEAYTERKSLSNLLKSPDIFKDMATKVKVGKWASKIGVDALKEGLEEVEANALNTIAALVFDYRDNDSFLSAIDKAKAEGKSDSEALAEAIKAVAPEYVESFVVGALAGGAFGAVNTASSINTVNNVIDISSDYFGKNGTSEQSVERLLIDMGYSDEAEIAKAANAIVRKGNGRSVDKNTEALFEDDVRLRGMLYGYVEAVDAGARRDTVSEVLDEARETETPEPTATSVPKNTTVTKPEAELTEEEIEARKEGYALINDDDAEESYRTRGRSGSKVYTYAVNKGGLIDELIKDGYSAEEATRKTRQLFTFMYNQGRINGNADIAIKAASENIVSGYEAQAREFFVAGQMDAQGRLIGKTNARLVPNQTLKNMQSNGQINSLTVRAINTLASKLGINIAFSDTMKDGALGSFNKKTGTLLISSKAKNKYFLTAVHESIHTIRTIHPESYNKMNEVVYDILKDNKAVHSKAWNKILSSYKKEATKDGKIDRDLINEELTAKVVSHLLTDESYIKELARTDRKGLQRIYDAIVDFFDKIFKRYSEDASPREAEFKDALKELQGEFNTIKAMYENALKETTNVQRSKMVLPESGDGANVLNSKVITKEDVKLIQSIGRKSLNDLTEEELKKLESVARKYYEEMGVKSPFFRRWFGDWRAEDKSPVNVVIANNKIFENATNHKELTNLLKEYLKEKSIYRGNTVNEDTKFNIIIGAVGYNDTISYAIRELHKKYISFDDVKKRANLLGNIKELIESSVLLNSEIINDKDNPNRIIMHTFYAVSKYKNENIIVKLKVDEFKDEKNPTKRFYNLNDIEIPSAGIEGSTPLTGTDGNKSEISDINTVSDLFSLVKTYDKDFKPKPNSLVLNEDGTPKVMYRGDAEEFTVFDRKKSRYTNLYGRGFYFTDSKAHAMQYGNAREFYLNIRNPLKPNQHKITQSQLTKFLEIVAEDEDYDIYNYGTTNVSEIVNSIYGKGDFEMLQDVSATAIGDLVETIELFNAVNNTEYDGVILPTETVVYNPNNIKSAENGGTFSSWDDDILSSKESTDDTSAENIDPGVQDTTAEVEAAYFELKKEVQKKLDEHIKKYGAIKKGEDAVRDAQFPVQTSDDRYVRRFTRTAFEADSVTDEVAAEIAEEVANGSLWTTYSRITDKKSTDTALNRFESLGYEGLLKEWEGTVASGKEIKKDDIAEAMVLVQEASKRGDMKTAMSLIAEIAAEGTRAGQLVQSLSLLKKLGGLENVYYIERTIHRIQKDIDNKYKGKKKVTIKVPEDLLKKYREMYDREKKSGSQDHSGSDKILDDIMKNVAEQIPATWADKFNTWRYFAMLGNPRTHIRNLAGNTFFMPLILAKNMVAAIGEGLAAPAAKLFGKNMQRTKTLGGVLSFGGEYMRYGKKDAQKIEAMLRGEKKYSELQKIMQSRKIFTSKFSAFFKVNEKVNKNTKRLEQEDWIFLKHNYARALTMYMKANKLSPDTITEKQLETARLYAVREAQKASFRDESALAKVIQRTEKSHKALGFAVGALMPFKQTPINVLKRGIEYSPVGAITTVGKGIKGVYEGKFSATEFIDGLGATLSGTGLCCLGVYLASQGLLFGPGDDDDENRMNILNGIQNYSLKIGNGTYTIDWASPAAMSLFVGCEIWNSLADKEERTFADIADALMSITEPVFEMSMLEGLMSVFRAGVYATRDSEAATEALTSIIPNYFSQFVPAILGQIARTIDPVRRKTYVDKNKNVPEWLQLFGQQMAKKFPGTSFLLDPYVNAKGETELNAEGNIFSRAMQNFFSPGYYKSIKSNEVDSEISRLYEKFGSDANEVIPKTVGRKIGDINLSSEQYTKYQQVTGQAYYSKLKEIISSDYYQNLSDTDKVRLLKKAREYAVEKGKEETLSDYHSSEGWLMKAFETDGLYRHVLNEVKEGKFSEEDLVGDAREFYEEEKDKIFSDILAEYNPDKLDYELADKFYEDLYDLSEKIALEANSDGQYVIEDTWINNAKELEAEERAQYIYGRAILTQYDDQDKANDALQNDSFISDKVRGYLLEKSSFSSDNPSKLYSNHVARHSNEISFEEYTKLWEKWEAAEKYKVGNKTIDKKDQILPEINKLKISNAAKSRIYDSFDWGNSEKALKNVPWSYVPDSQSPDVLSKRVGQDISAKSSYASKNSPYNKNNNDADFGQCVWYARGRAKELLGKNIPAMGNANQMFANAKKNSKVEAKPENLRANMLVTYKTGTSTAGQYAGHVIYIEAVDGDTVYYTEGGNYNMSGKLRTATREDIMTGITDDRKLGSDIIGFIDVTKY